MRQYLDVKSRYPDAIVLFRLGDFYEMFYDDAVYAARVLDLTLTTRDKGKEDPVPMCGVPHHAVRSYLGKLTDLGHRVALCEQLEDPKVARGIVKRDVVRVITPGVVLDEESLDPRAPSYVAAAVGDARGGYGFAFLDVTTGEFRATEAPSADVLVEEIGRVAPRELVLGRSDADRALAEVLRPGFPRLPRAAVDDGDPAVELPRAFGAAFDATILQRLPRAAAAAAAVLRYARATQPGAELPLVGLRDLRADRFADHRRAGARAPRAGGVAAGSPARRLAHRSARRDPHGDGGAPAAPLAALSVGRAGHDPPPPRRGRAAGRRARRPRSGAQAARRDRRHRAAGRPGPARRGDAARSGGAGTLAGGAAGAGRGAGRGARRRDRRLAGRRGRSAAAPERRRDDELAAELAAELTRVLRPDAPALTKDGGYVNAGVSAELDELVDIASGGRSRIAAIETRERERTGIPSLKIKFNNVFGYYIEVTRSNLGAVPADYRRKQTVANAERFVTTELAEFEATVLSADERRIAMELALFTALRARVAGEAERLLALGARVAAADTLAALAEVAHRNGYCRPLVDDGGVIDLADARHPVVERLAAAGSFVPNDVHLDPAAEQILIVSGPNMAGKSTLMRQVALAVIQAQMGGFVAARARAHRPLRSDLHPRRRRRQPGPRRVDLHGRDARDGADPPPRHGAQPDRPRRDRARHLDLRRRLDRLGGRRADPRPDRRQDAVRHALPRAGGAGGPAPARPQRQRRRRASGRGRWSSCASCRRAGPAVRSASRWPSWPVCRPPSSRAPAPSSARSRRRAAGAPRPICRAPSFPAPPRPASVSSACLPLPRGQRRRGRPRTRPCKEILDRLRAVDPDELSPRAAHELLCRAGEKVDGTALAPF